MKRFLAAAVIVLATLSTARAQQACRLDNRHGIAGVIGSTIGTLVGSTVGDGQGRSLATSGGAMLGRVLRIPLTRPRLIAASRHPLVKKLQDHQDQVIQAAVSGKMPIPRKPTGIRTR